MGDLARLAQRVHILPSGTAQERAAELLDGFRALQADLDAVEARRSWFVGSKVEIYSQSKKKWFAGVIAEEQVVAEYESATGLHSKRLARNDPDLRPVYQ